MLAAQLKRARQRARKSQRAVAEALGVRQPTISRWEAGESAPSLEVLRRLADLYGTRVSTLISA